jgi:hypothetical protein
MAIAVIQKISTAYALKNKWISQSVVATRLENRVCTRAKGAITARRANGRSQWLLATGSPRFVQFRSDGRTRHDRASVSFVLRTRKNIGIAFQWLKATGYIRAPSGRGFAYDNVELLSESKGRFWEWIGLQPAWNHIKWFLGEFNRNSHYSGNR